MKPVKILGSIGAVALLSAASCGPVNPDDKCLTFNQFTHRQKFPTNPYMLGEWQLRAIPDRQIEMYDPSTDHGPASMIGPLLKGEIIFTPTPGSPTFSSVKITYLSYNPLPSRVRLLDLGSTQIEERLLQSAPENTALESFFSPSQRVAHIVVENASGEAQIAKICVR